MSYLSVDLDYWTNLATQRSSKQFFRKLMGLDVPLMVVKHHQFILNDLHINKPKDNTLINIDYHSDISSENYTEPKRLNCGNWADFVKWRRTGNFIWVYPDKEECYTDLAGICDGTLSKMPFESHPVITNMNKWKNLEHFEGAFNVDLNAVERICVAISPDYYRLKTVRDIMHMLIEQVPPPRIYKTDTNMMEYYRVSAASSQFHPYKYIDIKHYNMMKEYFIKRRWL